MADKCYTVVEVEKWHSNAEIVNKNNHNFRLDPVAVLNPHLTYENEIIQSPNIESTRQKWNELIDKLNKEINKYKEETGKQKISGDQEFINRFAKQMKQISQPLKKSDIEAMVSLTEEEIDLKKSINNERLVGNGKINFIQQINDRTALLKKKPRVDSVREVGVIMKVTGGWDKLPKNFDLEKWKKDSMQWLKNTYGEDNILSAVLHVDEFTPHLQAVIIPLTPDGRLCAKEVVGNWEKCSEMQRTYYETVKQEGLYQGEKRRAPVYEDQRRAYNALVTAGDIELPEPMASETKEQYFARANETYKSYGMQTHLKLKAQEREYIIETSELQDTVLRLTQELQESKKQERIAKEKARAASAENAFLKDQIGGNGLTREEIKNSALLIEHMKEKHENDMKESKIKLEKAMQKISDLQSENVDLKDRVAVYDRIIGKDGLTKAAFNNNLTISYIAWAFEHGFPQAETTKYLMGEAYNYAKTNKDRIEALEK